MKRDAVLVFAALLGLGAALSGTPAAQAQTTQAQTTRAQAVVEGTIEWARRSSLGAPVTGVVARVDVASGDRVESGQVLLALDRGRFDAAVAAARARAARLEPDVAEARREFERAEDLYERTLVSEHEVELARIALARVEADAAHAKAMLRIAEIDRGLSVVRAPFAGIVIERRVEVGEVVNAGVANAALVELGDMSRLVARALLESSALAHWPPGLDVMVLTADRRIAGRVRRVSIEPVRGAGAGVFYAVDVEFKPAADTPVRIGQRVKIERR